MKTLLDPMMPSNLVLLSTDGDLFNENATEGNFSAMPEVRSFAKVCRFSFDEKDEEKMN